jgi:hypothetical protein
LRLKRLRIMICGKIFWNQINVTLVLF